MITKEIEDLARSYNAASTAAEARELRSQLFTAMLNTYGAPHYLVTFSDQDFITTHGVAKISSIVVSKDGVSYVLQCLPGAVVAQNYDYLDGGGEP